MLLIYKGSLDFIPPTLREKKPNIYMVRSAHSIYNVDFI